MARELRRKTPEECLLEVAAEEKEATRRGHLKIFLGYASGVGKSFRMLDEARRRRERGQDIVVGAMQPKVPPEVERILGKLEVIPLKTIDGGTGIDVEAILRRRPAICVIDGLAYDNPPGSRNPTRWRDVQDLLNAGIKVIASINIQYVRELAAEVEAISGKHVNETVPVDFVRSADEIEIVDAPPEEPIERTPEEQELAAKRAERFSRLRELALVLAADVVDRQLNEYLERHGVQGGFGASERVLVCVTPRAGIEAMVAAARIVAERFHGEWIAAYVKQPDLSPEDEASINAKLALARQEGAHVEILEGDDPAGALLRLARSRGVTQLFVGHTQRRGLAAWRSSPLDKLIWEGHGMDVHVFPQ